MKLVNAQQARRVLDRIVGYQGSQLLWTKVRRGLSMGRVQSVAMRLICEREQEREAFRAEEYWSIAVMLSGTNPPPFEAKLHSINGQDASIATETDAQRIVEAIQGKEFVVDSIERKEKRRNPVAPFITSRLQQEAARKLHFSSKKTMTLAQKLYEGIEIGAEGPDRSHYLHEDRFPAHFERGDDRSAPGDPGTVWRRILARHAERV